MKKIIFYSLICVLLSFSSCDLFKMDNYDEPAETLEGEVVDVATGERVLTDQGIEGIRVSLTELSWGDNVLHNPYFYCMPDGSYLGIKAERMGRSGETARSIARQTYDGCFALIGNRNCQERI